ncbi:hypothetical protein FHT02_003726 [Sphingomonas xinjiangensis]|uniref:Uncharacterized protein n=1 Tax=Sphingomonas xinjiangensis TaxID=643568 RepID=A0A840YS09_9SPHN|nr:hypothetical protein [Sphingomonas xinjiangensis]
MLGRIACIQEFACAVFLLSAQARFIIRHEHRVSGDMQNV